ncbi:MAG: hypothetical protein U0175_25705 [Caldilineaceae bacterium]
MNTAYTNQTLINAFFAAGKSLKLNDPWTDLVERAGLDWLVNDRNALYQGTPPEQLPNLDDTEKKEVTNWLDVLTGAAPHLPEALPLPIVPETPSGKPFREEHPELYEAWRKHIEQGLNNNNVMFKQILEGFMNPYWTTVWMYRILFGVGIASFVVSAYLGVRDGTSGGTLFFGGLSIVSLLTYFVSRPLQALEENLQFITWLGVSYNTYWTRLLYTMNSQTAQSEIEQTTNDAIAKIKELMSAQAERSKHRFGLR